MGILKQAKKLYRITICTKNSKKNENRQCKSNETNYRISLRGLSNNTNLIRKTIFTPK